MKRRVLVFLSLATAVAGLALGGCKQSSPCVFKAIVEELPGDIVTPPLDMEQPLALWDDGLALSQCAITAMNEGLYTIERADSTLLSGVARMVYPAMAAVEAEYVRLDTLQRSLPMGEGMVRYGETTVEEPNKVVLKAVSGMLRLDLTTDVPLKSVTLSTDDSNRFMTGLFSVTNYPFPVLTATDESCRHLTLTGLEGIAFDEGGEVCCYLAPGCYKTFTVLLTAIDGRSCTKSLKEDKEVVVDRNRVVTIHLGSTEEPLVFE
ncbi:MAG: hypothetical protein IJK84_06295 [Bacteroidales bacterium]|nr:hypothetical protein [Bacteroidales bacterium]